MAGLKVFRATLGFYETVVAAPSQKAALAAWGLHQNLFKDGSAGVTDDPSATAAAVAQPGVVLRRGLGTTNAYRPATEPTGPAREPAPKRKPPNRAELTAAEKALEVARSHRDEAFAGIAARKAALDEEDARLRLETDAELGDLEAGLQAARGAFVQAGGRIAP